MTHPQSQADSAGYTEAEGYAASLRQQASWIEQSPAAEMIDADELRAAANYIERLARSSDASSASEPVAQLRGARCGSAGDTYVLCSGCGSPALVLSSAEGK